VGLDDLVGGVEVVLADPERLSVDAGVVDEHVEAAGIRLDPLAQRVDAVLVGDVELRRERLAVDLGRGAIRRGEVAPADEDEKAVVLSELARDLAPNPAVGAADERDGPARAHDSTRPIVFGSTPSRSASAGPRGVTIGISISSASSQVANTGSPTTRRSQISVERTSGSRT